MARMRAEMLELEERCKDTEREKTAVQETNTALVEELMEQLLLSTRRCDEMDGEVRSMQAYAAEMLACREEAGALGARLAAAEAARAEVAAAGECYLAELEPLREAAAAWGPARQGLEGELAVAREQALAAGEELACLREEARRVGGELDTLAAALELRGREGAGAGAATAAETARLLCAALEERQAGQAGALGRAEAALATSEEQLAELQARFAALSREDAARDLASRALRAEHAELGEKAAALERELDGACGEALALLEREEAGRAEGARLEQARAGLQEQLAAREAAMAEMVGRGEAERALGAVRGGLEALLAREETRAAAAEARCTELSRVAALSLADVRACSRDLEDMAPPPDFPPRRGPHRAPSPSPASPPSSSPASAHSPGSAPGSAAGAEQALPLAVQALRRGVAGVGAALCPVRRAVAETCVYMLRGRRRHTQTHTQTHTGGRDRDRDNNYLNDIYSNYNANDVSGGGDGGGENEEDPDLSLLSEGAGQAGVRLAAEEVACLPLQPAAALAATWHLFLGEPAETGAGTGAGTAGDDSPAGAGVCLSADSIGLGLLAGSLGEALAWRVQLDDSMRADRARLQEQQAERHRHMQSKLKLRVCELEEALGTQTLALESERAEGGRRYETKSAEHRLAAQEAQQLERDRRRLREGAAQRREELHTAQVCNSRQ
jgi:hypothetical protein